METKKIFVALIAILAVLALVSCAGGGDSNSGGGSDSGGDNTQSEHVHTEEIIPAKEATCTENGLTEGKKCTDCGEILVVQEIIPASHKYENSYTCVICKEELYKPSDGLEYALSDDGTYYTVTGIGLCSDRNIVIPYTYNELPITSIGDRAFYRCVGRLTEIVIPDSVTRIGDGAFANCVSLMSIMVDEDNKYFKSIDNNLYSKYGEKLIQYAIGKKDTYFEIPSGVTCIDRYAFISCDSLTSVAIGNSVTSIGEYTFAYCDSLTEIVIPNSIKNIGNYAFENCNNLTIYCEAESKPSSWDAYWNSSSRPVVWGHIHEYENGECVCGMKEQ